MIKNIIWENDLEQVLEDSKKVENHVSSKIPNKDLNEEEKNSENQKNDEEFEKWCEKFQLSSKSSETSQILSTNSVIFELYQSLVPNELSPEDFWARYYFKYNQALQKETKRLEVLSKAENVYKQEELFSWDENEHIKLVGEENREVLKQAEKQNFEESQNFVKNSQENNEEDVFGWE